MATIVIENGKDKGKAIDLGIQDEWVFGRDSSCHVPFEDSLASRRHFSLKRTNDSYSLTDLGSRNGIFINGDRIKKALLEYGDQVSAGNTIFSFLKDEEAKTRGGLVGQTIGGFRIEQRLGRGGMGTVFRAVQLSLDRVVALKVLSRKHTRNPGFVKRFVQEARAAGSLNHPSIVEVYDVGEDKSFHFFSMEYLPGGSLEDLLNHTDKLLPIAALSLIRDIARGLQFAESRGIIHRDIKPENLMLDHEARAKICDLGIAVSREAGVTGAAGALGTPHYIAPEQAEGKRIDHRADIYSLGCTFYRMLTGRFPFDGETPKEIVRKHKNEKPIPVSELAEEASSRLCRLVGKMMAKSPKHRFADATELLKELDSCLAEELGTTIDEVEVNSNIRTDFPKRSVKCSRRSGSAVRKKKIGIRPFLNLTAASLLLVLLARAAINRLATTQHSQLGERTIASQDSGTAEGSAQPQDQVSAPSNTLHQTVSASTGQAAENLAPPRAKQMDMAVSHIVRKYQHKAVPPASARLKISEKPWETAIASAQQSINAFHFGEAIARLHAFMKSHTGKNERDLASQCIQQIQGLARQAYKARSVQIQQLLRDGELNKATALLEEVSSDWSIEPFSSEAREQLSKIRQMVVKNIR